ncbi:MAG TPA: DUF5060 domain-containing protein [Bryobacteraceae bacterium]|nr:DUF5060 domain-containing protein [Bryobacteraceae bacterium]
MGTRLATILIALASLALRGQTPAAAPSPCSNTPTYSPCEMVFELSDKDAAAHPNPYMTVDVKVEFRSPRRRTLAVPAYWDGGRRMVVRFSPNEAGDWDYHVAGNIADWADKEGSFTAVASDSRGFIRPANQHHWAYTERDTRGLDQAHLWMGASEMLFATLDDAAFRSVADARAAQKFNHLRCLVVSPEQARAFASPDSPGIEYFQRLDQRVRYLNQKGITADLVLAGGAGYLTKAFPTWQQRSRFLRFVVGRYAAMNVTWQAVDAFEDYPDTRALLKETGTLLKQLDPYQHPRTSGAHLTSTPLLDDGWMSFAAYGTPDDNLGAVEHQLYAVPFVNLDFGREDSGAGKHGPDDVDAAEFRRRLWNATMDGQYPTYANTGAGAQYANSTGAKAMTAWFDLLSDTRHWELEPYFDVDGGRALALEDTEYVVYVEKPGPVELTVEKHSYEVYWINPADGESVVTKKKFSGEHFTGEPPSRSHDWVLHLVREGHLESMNKSFKFESRDILLQEVEANTPKVPFVMEQPTGDLSLSKPTPFSAKLTRESRATRLMRWLWMGEVAADHQGYKVLATGQKGTMQPPHSIATNFPALMHLRLYGMNANGKVYELDSACQINP